ncbi:putative Glucokinase [Candidatus Sulfotelmatobacter kueseliae]|uniref:Putative Glucokinase n=1 Tax=Candidatus Sulfotelmatobacter kueseliae TaxID=2042962 RepID=A0A2U3L5N5_9BACT|nr:putative Glucokinase [Candidatus Sulfotelmatobacter kueseliae]
MPSHVFAADLGGTKCSAARIDRKGRVVSCRTVPVDLTSPSGPVLQIRQLAEELAEGRNPAKAFSAAAVAVPGLVRQNGTVWAPNLPGWERMPLARRLRRLLGVPVVVESDRIAAVLGECWKGAAQGRADAIVLMIGTGLGAGILSGGRVVRGAHELSGCVGWLTVTREDIPEAPGRGELESLAAGPGIVRAAQERLRNGEASSLSRLNVSQVTAVDIAAAARQGDRLARDVFHHAGRYLGFGVANLVSLFNPEIIVIGGGMAEAADLYLTSLTRAMAERAQPLAATQVKIRVSTLGNKVNLLGCARLAWEVAGRAVVHNARRSASPLRFT